MKIRRLRLENYKSIRNVDGIEFGIGMNFVVGQNNSGKSALLTGLRLINMQNKPHIGPTTDVINPTSSFEVGIEVPGVEFQREALRHGGAVYWPVRPEEGPNDVRRKLASKEIVRFHLKGVPGQCSPASYPSHCLFVAQPQHLPRSVFLRPSESKQGFAEFTIHNGGEDNAANVIHHMMREYIYCFDAERMSIGRCAFNASDVLESGAQNFPKILLRSYGDDKFRENYNDHVREIFPHIENVYADIEGQNVIAKVGMIVRTQRNENISFLLEECGTGVGQVLSILLVAMSKRDCVIVIDEPNSFLHPGAAKKLIQILRKYDTNQYIISTHSADIISAAEPDSIHQVRWEKGESIVEEFDRSNVDHMRNLLRDVGADLTDVFGLYNIVWVEGPTETSCFRDLALLSGYSSSDVAFCTLRNTGDLEQKGPGGHVIAEIYGRLSAGASLLPPAVAFHLDKETRNATQQADLKRRTDANIQFLPRRMFENYLIHVDAIVAVLNSELAEYDAGIEVREAQVIAWLQKNSEKFSGPNSGVADYRAAKWLKTCDGANLLSALFGALGQRKADFRKTRHSPMLTRWLIDHDRSFLDELIKYVDGLCKAHDSTAKNIAS